MSNLIYKYPLDLNGYETSNRIEGELLVLTLLEDGRAISIPSYSPYFVSSVTLTSSLKGELKPKDHFKTIHLDDELTRLSTGTICSAIYIDYVLAEDETIAMDYQTIGHPHTSLTTPIAELVLAVKSDNRPIQWNMIIDKPKTYRPDRHKHPLGDLFGFEHIVRELSLLRDTLMNKHLYGSATFSAEDRERLISIQTLIGELTNKTYNNQVILSGIYDLLEDAFVNAPLPNKLDYLVEVELEEVVAVDKIVILGLSGRKEGHTYTIISDTFNINQTENVISDNVFFPTHGIPDGIYTLSVYATDGDRRTIKTFKTIRINRG